MTASSSSLAAYRESVRLLDCEGDRLLAIVAAPERQASGDLGVVVIVGGPQYRSGSHRQFVQLARLLAAAGTPVLRFDVRGMGDSTGAQRSFEHLATDTGAAIDGLLAAQPQLRRVALWGLCDGASAALLYLHDRADPRVAALCLLNPWARSEASLARTHVKHYYRRRLMQREFWGKLVTGRVAGEALRSLWSNLRAARTHPKTAANLGERDHSAADGYQTRMAQAWQRFTGPILLVLSGRDYTAREFIEYVGSNAAWRGALSLSNVQRHDMTQADHTFSARVDEQHLAKHTLAWLGHSAST